MAPVSPALAPATLVDYMALHAHTQPDKLYLRHGHGATLRDVTFGDVARVADAFRGRFGATELRGHVCFAFFDSGPASYLTLFGLMAAGAIPALMPLPSAKQDPAIYWAAHRALFDVTKPAAVFAGPGDIARMRANGVFDGAALAVETTFDFDPVPDVAFNAGMAGACSACATSLAVSPGTVAFIQHSSGTTGLKKGVMLTHGAVLRQIAAYGRALEVTPDDVVGTWLPLYHDMGLIACTIMPMVLGCTVRALDPFAWTTRPAMILDVMERDRASLCWMPNFAFEHLMRTTRDRAGRFGHVRALINCSEMVKPATMQAFSERFGAVGLGRGTLSACYAMAETVFAVSQVPPGQPVRTLALSRAALAQGLVRPPAPSETVTALTGCGRVLDGLEVRIADSAPADVGEIMIRGDFLFDGYYNRPDVTAQKLRAGWYHTGDLGFLHKGELFVTGRLDDLVIVHGKNIYAHEVEATVSALEGIRPGRVVCFGIDGDMGTHELCIVAETLHEPAATQTETALRGRIIDAVHATAAVMPCRVTLVAPDALLKTTSGKISRHLNARRFSKTSWIGQDRIMADTADRIFSVIKAFFKIGDDTPLTRETTAKDVSGWDSLAHATLIFEIENALDIEYEMDQISAFTNVGEMIDVAKALRGQS